MAREVDTVNMSSRGRYHHGRLRESLVDAGVELARSSGPEAVVLRAVTRAAGVSHNAAYRHFADHQDLIDAVAERCMSRLADLMRRRMAEVAEPSPQQRAEAELRAIGRAYLEFALAEPGLFRTAFAVRKSPSAQPLRGDLGEAEYGPYELLAAQLDRLVSAGVLPAERRPGAEYAAWSAVHGLSMLLVQGPLRDLPPAERERAVDVVLTVVGRGL
jgi:AcrR family transcriptional regulator